MKHSTTYCGKSVFLRNSFFSLPFLVTSFFCFPVSHPPFVRFLYAFNFQRTDQKSSQASTPFLSHRPTLPYTSPPILEIQHTNILLPPLVLFFLQRCQIVFRASFLSFFFLIKIDSRGLGHCVKIRSSRR